MLDNGVKKLNFSRTSLRGDLVIFYKNLHGEKISEGRFFINVTEKDIMRSNDWKLKVDKFRPELRFDSQGYQTVGTISPVVC